MRFIAAMGAILLTICGSQSSASVVFSTVPTIISDYPAASWCSSCYGSYRVYDYFVLDDKYTLSDLDISLSSTYFIPNAITFSVNAMAPTGIGSELFSTTIGEADFLSLVSVPGGVAQLKVALPNWTLDKGGYWLSAYNPQNLAVPGFSSTRAGLYQEGIGGHPGQTVAFTLYGNSAAGAVPEPSSWTMLILGFGAVGFAMRQARRPHGVRVSLAK